LKKLVRFRFPVRLQLLWLSATMSLSVAVWLAFGELPAQRDNSKSVADKVRALETQLRTQAAVSAALPQNLAAQNGLQMSDATLSRLDPARSMCALRTLHDQDG
jgi:hypothetical protein